MQQWPAYAGVIFGAVGMFLGVYNFVKNLENNRPKWKIHYYIKPLFSDGTGEPLFIFEFINIGKTNLYLEDWGFLIGRSKVNIPYGGPGQFSHKEPLSEWIEPGQYVSRSLPVTELEERLREKGYSYGKQIQCYFADVDKKVYKSPNFKLE